VFGSVGSALKGEFNLISFNDNSQFNFTDLLDLVNLNNDQIVGELFGNAIRYENSSENQKMFYKFLVDGCEIPPYTPILRNSREFKPEYTFKTTVGLGVFNKHDIPKEPVRYGRVYINLDKLYYKNLLSIKSLEGKVVQSFKNANVSNDFVNYIMKLIYKDTITESDYKKLSPDDISILDELNYLAGFEKERNLNKKDIITELEKDLNLIIGSIEAGNNNPQMLEKVRTILMKLASFDAISLESARKYYKQLKTQF
jgi:hypothetical protein